MLPSEMFTWIFHSVINIYYIKYAMYVCALINKLIVLVYICKWKGILHSTVCTSTERCRSQKFICVRRSRLYWQLSGRKNSCIASLCSSQEGRDVKGALDISKADVWMWMQKIFIWSSLYVRKLFRFIKIKREKIKYTKEECERQIKFMSAQISIERKRDRELLKILPY